MTDLLTEARDALERHIIYHERTSNINYENGYEKGINYALYILDAAIKEKDVV